MSSYEACAAGLKQVEADLGPVEVLVNNAGITRDAMFHRMKPEQWSAVINTNLSSLFNMCRPVIEGMRARKFGRIINISSINGQKGQMGQANYSAAKAGELGFTKALAQESAKSGITVNAICPGYIATEMVKAVPKDVLEKNILPLIPVGRLGEPEEIARCVVFLASDDAGFITGSTLSANGGQFMGELAQLRAARRWSTPSRRGRSRRWSFRRTGCARCWSPEAELGERIMRALILRRVGLLETGAGGPVIVGRAENGDVLRLEGFLRRNGHPHQRLDPETDAEAKALIERFHVDPGQLPIVLCPGGQLLRNPSEDELARCIGLVGPIDPDRVYDVAIVGAGPAGLAAGGLCGARKGCRCWCSTAARSAARPAPRRGSRTISASRPASPAWR